MKWNVICKLQTANWTFAGLRLGCNLIILTHASRRLPELSGYRSRRFPGQPPPAPPRIELETKPRAFSWLKVPTSTFTFKTLLRHYAKQALTHRPSLSL